MNFFFFLFFYIFFFSSLDAKKYSNYENYPKTRQSIKFEEIAKGQFDYPWGMTFIDNENLLITEKNGRLLEVNINSGKVTEISHNIPSIKYDGESIAYQQGGLLDVYAHSDGYIYFTYSYDFKEKMVDGKPSKASSTAIARGKLNNKRIEDFKNLLIAEPELHANKHWGSRIVIKDEKLYVSFGERDGGMIAQDPQKHPGSIVRINKDGSIPKDNPAYKGYEEWLPEIYQIGMRNPQGMTISPDNDKIYFSQHGPMGGDNIGVVKFAGNFGWKDIAWGGSEYSGRKIGSTPFKDKYDKPVITWVPSMAIGNIAFYNGDVFPEWKGDLIVSATKAQILARLDFENNKIVHEEFIFRNVLGRIRDFEIDNHGNIFIITDEENSSLWKMTKK
jgi:quinoprotein glucose dehydrogenase